QAGTRLPKQPEEESSRSELCRARIQTGVLKVIIPQQDAKVNDYFIIQSSHTRRLDWMCDSFMRRGKSLRGTPEGGGSRQAGDFMEGKMSDDILPDILEQPQLLAAALRAHMAPASPLEDAVRAIERSRPRRIVLSGMGSSLFACYPAFLR